MTPTSIPNKLRYLRKQKRVTQKQAASHIGVSVATYVSYECGDSIPSTVMGRQNVADYYGVDSAWLFGEDACKQRVRQHCGNLLPSNVPFNRLYCSDECCKAEKQQRYAENRKNVRCVICGAPLGKFKHAYCSQRCRRRAEAIEKLSETKYCKNCGTALDSNRKLYCSPECAEEYRRKSVPAETFREQWDPKSGETYTEYKLRVFPRYRGIYIRPGGKR